jgi:hypothetical protein
MLQQYSELCLPGQYAKESRAGQYMSTDKTHRPCTPPHCWLPPQRGQTGESDLRLHHIPEDFEFLDHKYDDTPIELLMRQRLSR